MSDLNGEKRRSSLRVVIVLLILLGIGTTGILGIRAIIRHRAKERYAALSASQTTEPQTEEAPSETVETLPAIDLPEDVVLPDKTIDWETLRGENEDIYAWIMIPGTNVDYPVLQHAEELDYYLDHNLDHSQGYPGCIYTRFHNSTDFEDPNTVIYGHNMKDGSMFRTLHYFEDGAFFAEHPYLYVWQEDRLMVYEIFAAYSFTDHNLLSLIDFNDPDAFKNYLDDLMAIRNLNVHLRHDTFVPLDENCRIITLSTCFAGAEEVRYLVQAVRIGTLEDNGA